MTFQSALSGLNHAALALDVVGNNIANAETVGFKGARSQFADVFAAALSSAAPGSNGGLGTSTAAVVQSFVQGPIRSTNNPLDMAINGKGFFRVDNGGTINYTRNGEFRLLGQLDAAGGNYSAAELAAQNAILVNEKGYRVTGYNATYTADPNGTIVTTGTPAAIVINPSMPASATTAVSLGVNLDSRAVPPSTATPATLTGSVVAPLNITAANNSFAIRIDGLPAAAPIDIDVPIGTYTTDFDLAAAMEQAINTNPAIMAQNTLVDVSAANGRMVVTARSIGGNSSIAIANASTPDGGVAALFGAAATVQGSYTFDPNDPQTYTTATAVATYDATGNKHNLTAYFVKDQQPNTWQVYTTLDKGNAVGSVDLSTLALPVSGGMTFTVSVDGSAAATATLPGTYTSVGALRTAVQSAIDGAVGPGKAAVTLDSGNRLVVTSATAGASSDVTIAGAATLFGAPVMNPGAQSGPATLVFNSLGTLQSGSSATLALGTALPAATLDFAGSSQYGIPFSVNAVAQDGYAAGTINGVSVDTEGIIHASYSNSRSRQAAQLALANFTNVNGLVSTGDNLWTATAAAGKERIDVPNNYGSTTAQGLGAIKGRAVEDANIELNAELVTLITQQRYYQANAQSIKAQDQIMQTLAGIR